MLPYMLPCSAKWALSLTLCLLNHCHAAYEGMFKVNTLKSARARKPGTAAPADVASLAVQQRATLSDLFILLKWEESRRMNAEMK